MIKKLALLLFLTTTSAALATMYSGNGNTGFGNGGAVGTSTLTITDDGTTAHFSLTLGNGNTSMSGNDLVFYVDSQAGGFGDTSGFTDTADGGRRATSGTDGTNRTTATFPTGFNADSALTIGDTFGVQFGLVNGGSFTLPGGLTNFNHTGGTYTFDVSLAALGLTPGQSFSFVGTEISETAFRSDEGYGTGIPPGNPGFTGAITYTGVDTYTTTAAIPEPATILLVGPSLLAGWFFVRRRRA